MINISKRSLTDAEHAFVNRIASLFVPWGMALISARVYGYLLLHEVPVGLDRIAADLKVSKVSAWKAARDLETFGHVKRYGEPGSKRALYGPTNDFAVPIRKQCELLGALGDTLEDSAATIVRGDTAARLQTMAQFYFALQKAMGGVIRQLEKAAPRAGKATKKRVAKA